jgi:hypothetical protein
MLVLRKGSQAQRELVRNAALWYIDEVLPNTGIRLTISFSNKLDCLGTAIFNGSSSSRSKNFSIMIDDKLEGDELLETILHEMVHIWQMASKSVRYVAKSNKYVAFWKGNKFDPEKGYSSQPWERQAYYYEKILVERYKESLA